MHLSPIEVVNTQDKQPHVVVLAATYAAQKYLEPRLAQAVAEKRKTFSFTRYVAQKLDEIQGTIVRIDDIFKAQKALAIIGTLLNEFPPDDTGKWTYCEHPDTRELGFWYEADKLYAQSGRPLLSPDDVAAWITESIEEDESKD